MKKVYGGDILAKKENDAESDPENSIIENVTSKSFNVFDMLEKSSEDEQPEDREEENCEEICSNETSQKKDNRKKRGRKKKRNKLDEAKNQQVYDNEHSKELEDEIEKTVKEVNKLLGEPVPSCSSHQPDSIESAKKKSKEDVLMIQHKYLNPYNELKKIFGSKTVQAEQSNRRNRGRTGHIKKTWLVSSKEDWVHAKKFGLSMSLDHSMESNGNVQYFVYEHSPFYRQIQLKFLAAVDSLNPENIISIINAHPYHVDALMQLAEICKLRLEDLPMAAKYTERALYCLECGFHPLFDVTSARCRLDYRKQQNRALFIALFKHLGFIGGRACYRTSLEFCKLLLSLDPEGDPLAIVLSIDFYALRAKEYEWFIEFCYFWENTRNLTQLPNIAYSLALAHFHLNHQTFADELLQNALIMFPGVLLPLLDKCSIQADDKVLNHQFFNSTAISTTTPALETLQKLYIARSFHLWKEPEVLLWLKEVVHTVLDRVDSKDEYVKYCEVKRSKRYQGRLPRNILRNIILSDIEEVTADIHESHNDGSVLSHDPLPPTDSIDIYKRPSAGTITTSSNLLSLLFSSILSDINADATVPAFEVVNEFYENNEQT